ncbi:hypothetical protein P3T76_011178 [Phytophthora citrophthora]|uniref:Uncharacterized protein n=1 Tax=Phytophthora citrophthora TaxID=4793 RepID=A0AAD9LGL0_9STRA|nr:hypothetical protein P3T76_011178 [Phytophthora citrophthora]
MATRLWRDDLLFTYELARRRKAQSVSGVSAVACHLGFTSTNLMGPPSSEGGWFSRSMWRVASLLPILQDASTGALPTLYAATGSDVESGDFYGAGNYLEIWEARPAQGNCKRPSCCQQLVGGERTPCEGQAERGGLVTVDRKAYGIGNCRNTRDSQ